MELHRETVWRGGKGMEVLQGDINREDYYSVRECAEILGVTPKTIRNRIEDKKLNAIWHDLGRGKSQWLILKSDIDTLTASHEEKLPRQISLPSAFMEEIKAQIRAENEILRAEIQEVKQTQERIEKSLLERDEKLLTVIRERMEERQEQSKKAWWQVWK